MADTTVHLPSATFQHVSTSWRGDGTLVWCPSVCGCHQWIPLDCLALVATGACVHELKGTSAKEDMVLERVSQCDPP